MICSEHIIARWVVALVLLAGCTESRSPPSGVTHVGYKDLPVTVNRDVDVLFIIDDSPSTHVQTNLKLTFPSLANLTLKIERSEAPDPDTHVISYCVLEG